MRSAPFNAIAWMRGDVPTLPQGRAPSSTTSRSGTSSNSIRAYSESRFRPASATTQRPPRCSGSVSPGAARASCPSRLCRDEGGREDRQRHTRRRGDQVAMLAADEMSDEARHRRQRHRVLLAVRRVPAAGKLRASERGHRDCRERWTAHVSGRQWHCAPPRRAPTSRSNLDRRLPGRQHRESGLGRASLRRVGW